VSLKKEAAPAVGRANGQSEGYVHIYNFGLERKVRSMKSRASEGSIKINAPSRARDMCRDFEG
jgi:hypothetical protein